MYNTNRVNSGVSIPSRDAIIRQEALNHVHKITPANPAKK